MKKLNNYILEKLKIDKDVKAPIIYYNNCQIFWDKLEVSPNTLENIKRLTYDEHNNFRSLEETVERLNKLTDTSRKIISKWVNGWIQKMELTQSKVKKILGISNRYNDTYFNAMILRRMAIANEDKLKGR